MFVRSDSICAADIIWNSLENQLWLRQECEMISVETSNMYQNFPHNSHPFHISNSSKYSGIKDKHISNAKSTFFRSEKIKMSQFILWYKLESKKKPSTLGWYFLEIESPIGNNQILHSIQYTNEFQVVRSRRLDVSLSNRILQGCVKSVLVISWLIFEDRKLGFLWDHRHSCTQNSK